MELRDFVASSLVDIALGLRTANDRVRAQFPSVEGGSSVAFLLGPLLGNKEHNHIDFDIAVTVKREESAEGPLGVGIAVIESAVEGTRSTTAERASRIKFSVLLHRNLV